MQNEYPEDIIEAKDLLDKALRHSDHGKRTIYFEQAIDTFDGYLLDYPETPYKSYIQNLRVAYTKKLLEGLPSFDESDIVVDLITRYIVIFDKKVKKECQKIFEMHPNLHENYESFLDFFRGYIIE